MTFYEEMAGIATELLGEFKQGTVAFIIPGTTTPGENPWDPPIVTPPQAFDLDATAKGVSEQYVGTDGIVGTDTEVTIAPFGEELTTSTPLTIDGQAVTVVKVMRIPRAGEVVAWKVVVR
jgi:hypothetical protein